MRIKMVRGLLVWMGIVVFPSYLFALEVSVESRRIRPGSKVPLQVYVNDAVHIGNIAFDIEYDQMQLELLEAVPGQVMEGALFAMNPECFPSTSGLLRFNGVWAQGFSGNATLLELSFQLADSTSERVPVTVNGLTAAKVRAANGRLLSRTETSGLLGW